MRHPAAATDAACDAASWLPKGRSRNKIASDKRAPERALLLQQRKSSRMRTALGDDEDAGERRRERDENDERRQSRRRRRRPAQTAADWRDCGKSEMRRSRR